MATQIHPALFDAIILSELAKRRSAYPKALQKLRDNGASDDEVLAMQDAQRIQYEYLEAAYNMLRGVPTQTPISAVLVELERELTMRRKVYRHWVSKKWMTQEKADHGLAEWQAVIDHFKNNF